VKKEGGGGAKSNRRCRGLTEIIRACALGIDLEFEIGLSPRMHQTSNNRYYPNDYGSLRVTPIACPLETVIDHKKLNFLGQLCNLPGSYMAKHVFNIRLTHFQHLDNQSLGFIPDITRILTKYALHHVLDRYLLDGVFPSKCA